MTDIIKQACTANGTRRITAPVLRNLCQQACWDSVDSISDGRVKHVTWTATKGKYTKKLGTAKQAAEFFAVIIDYHTSFSAN